MIYLAQSPYAQSQGRLFMDFIIIACIIYIWHYCLKTTYLKIFLSYNRLNGGICVPLVSQLSLFNFRVTRNYFVGPHWIIVLISPKFATGSLLCKFCLWTTQLKQAGMLMSNNVSKFFSFIDQRLPPIILNKCCPLIRW